MEKAPVYIPEAALTASQSRRGRWKLAQWLVDPNSKVITGQSVAKIVFVPELSDNSSSLDMLVKAPHNGKLLTHLVKPQQHIHDMSSPISCVEFCPHAIIYAGLCAVCGEHDPVQLTQASTPARPPSLLLDTNTSAVNNSQTASQSQEKLSSTENKKSFKPQARVDVAYAGGELSVSRNEAESMSKRIASRMMRERRLFLVLDIDHTLLHAMCDSRAASAIPLLPEHVSKDIHSFLMAPDGFTAPAQTMYLKFRPSLMDFLNRMKSKFELHIYTNGRRAYANAVARVLDPQHELFRGRVVSRDDFPEGALSQKNLRRVFPCDDSMVLIVDDREDVWGQSVDTYLPNLLLVTPYWFFRGVNEVYDRTQPVLNAVNVPSVTKNAEAVPFKRPRIETNESREENELKKAEETALESEMVEELTTPDDLGVHKESADPSHEFNELARTWMEAEYDENQLTVLADILEMCHEQFYGAVDSDGFCDAKKIMTEIRRNVLDGCVVAFSGVFPTSTSPEQQTLWKMAERFGAICKHMVDETVTHLVADKRRGIETAKTNQAKRLQSVFIVKPNWMIRSCYHFKRASELQFSSFTETRETFSSLEGYREHIESHRRKSLSGDCIDHNANPNSIVDNTDHDPLVAEILEQITNNNQTQS
uniref:RNA polymerase II subunit A C-terminal domain phosphatase n=1 Tax=Timspurckia oligopyrenoides TaxID=708627 RepID=A0A7S0ZJJ3_9RHOD|mmetsp:Transcript_7784/g.14141  ORF Transcript_7784/g.14141 Transcript_7784/m.14141 type:complete len:649 (+) Transcript_7784:15-1961(+)